MELLERLNRTVKLALDDGTAQSIEDAERLFHSFNIQVHVSPEVRTNPALQAALATLLNAAPRSFLGDVVVTGDVHFQFCIGLLRGKSVRSAAKHYGVKYSSTDTGYPTVVVGADTADFEGAFTVHLGVTNSGFSVSPDSISFVSGSSIPLGVAAAGAALSECFQHLYFKRQIAGQRELCFDLGSGWPRPAQTPPSLTLIGAGHLGQAVLWVAGLACSREKPALIIYDDDQVSLSGVSTGLLSQLSDITADKVAVVAREMRALGFNVVPKAEKFVLDARTAQTGHVLVAVDNFNFRRGLDKLSAANIIEAGIGDGVSGFTQVQLHTLPGRRPAADIWSGGDPKATRRVNVDTPAYQKLIKESGNECGTTQLADRSIATPFIGAFAGALMFMLATAATGSASADSWKFDVNAL